MSEKSGGERKKLSLLSFVKMVLYIENLSRKCVLPDDALTLLDF